MERKKENTLFLKGNGGLRAILGNDSRTEKGPYMTAGKEYIYIQMKSNQGDKTRRKETQEDIH
jgi:hypothetical protein